MCIYVIVSVSLKIVNWFVAVYRTMTVQLQQNPSMFERGSDVRNSGNIRHNLHVSAYEKALLDLAHDKKLERDLAVGRQIGFYRIRGELGSGNFSHVKLGVHILTRGTTTTILWLSRGNAVIIISASLAL